MWKLVVFLVSLLLAMSSSGQDELQGDNLFSFDFKNEKLSKVLKKIKIESSSRIAFRSEDVKGVQITVKFEKEDLNQILKTVLPPGLDFNIIDDLIVIYKVELNQNNLNSQHSLSTFTLSGRIVDFFSGEVLPYATVYVPSTGQLTEANQEGRFQLFEFPSDTMAIRISYVGYREKEIMPKYYLDGESLEVRLKAETSLIDGVLVENYETTPLISSTNISEFDIDVLRLPQITNFGETDALALVTTLPGFDQSSESNLSLSSRGLRSDENLYYLDGLAVFNPSHFFGLFSSINSLSVKNIRVLKAGYNSSYGGRSAAVIDISSYSGNNEKLRLKAKTGLLSTSLRVDGPLFRKKVHFSVTGRKAHANIGRTYLYQQLYNSIYNSSISFAGNTSELNAFDSNVEPLVDFQDVQGKLVWDVSSKTKLEFSSFFSEDFSDQLIVDSLPTRDFSISYDNQYEWFNYGFSGVLKSDISERLYVKNQVSYSEFDSASNSEEVIRNNRFNESFNLQTGFVNEVSDFTIKSHWTNTFSDSLKAEFGLELNAFRASSSESSFGLVNSIDENEKEVYNVFVQLNSVKKRFSYDGGIRLVIDNTLNELFFEPRAHLNYQLKTKLFLKAGYGRHTQLLRKTRDLNFFRGSVFEWNLSSSNTPASIVDHAVLGLNYNKKPFVLDFEFFLLAQKGTSENATTILSLANQNREEIIFGNSFTKGFEFSGLFNHRRSKFSVGFTHIISESEFLMNEEKERFPNRNVSKNSANFLWLWENKSFRFSFNSLFSEGKPFTPVIGTFEVEIVNGSTRPFLIFGNYNSENLPLYMRNDVAFSYRSLIANKLNIELGASVQNLFNHGNLKYYGYSVLEDPEEEKFSILQREVRHLGRLFSFFLTLDF